MNGPFASLSQLLSDIILPNLKAVQTNQAEQIASNDRLERAIEELRKDLESQFALLTAQLTACQVELAATQASLKAAQSKVSLRAPGSKQLIH
jgi:outer membrane protein TolC